MGMSLPCSPSSPPTPATSFNRGLSLTVLRLCSFRIQRRYNGFRSELQSRLLDDSAAPCEHQESIDALQEVLQVDEEWKKAVATERHRGSTEATVVGGGTQPPAPVDNLLKILVCNAAGEFGFAPHDVYEGIFFSRSTKGKHNEALREVDYPKLVTLSKAFHMDCELDEYSHRIIAVSPVRASVRNDGWTIDFKSSQIAKAVVLSMLLLATERLRGMYDLLHNVPQTSGMAGRIFEAIAHRVLSGKDVPQSTSMISDKSIPPTFSATNTRPPPTSPRDRARTVTIVDLRDLSEVMSDSNRYYIPASATNPLFDSSTVALNARQRTAVISICQITTSPKHGESADGYLLIRKIMDRVRELLKHSGENSPRITVNYFLVCPDDGSKHQWKMPSGWDEDNDVNDHTGDAFCIRVPSSYLTVRRVLNLLKILQPFKPRPDIGYHGLTAPGHSLLPVCLSLVPAHSPVASACFSTCPHPCSRFGHSQLLDVAPLSRPLHTQDHPVCSLLPPTHRTFPRVPPLDVWDWQPVANLDPAAGFPTASSNAPKTAKRTEIRGRSTYYAEGQGLNEGLRASHATSLGVRAPRVTSYLL